MRSLISRAVFDQITPQPSLSPENFNCISITGQPLQIAGGKQLEFSFSHHKSVPYMGYFLVSPTLSPPLHCVLGWDFLTTSGLQLSYAENGNYFFGGSHVFTPICTQSPTSLASELPPPKVAQGQSLTSTDTVSSCFLVQSVSRGSVSVSTNFRDAHKKVGHLGKNAIVAKTRERCWIYGVSQLAKKIARECSTCRKYQARPNEQVMADLPRMRLQSDGAPFEHVEMDYFDQLIVKRGRPEVKRYGVIFTCMSSRGAHLEISHSLETDACINAIRRFMARRGPVKSITSDNGTNIVGAEKELREMLSWMDQSKVSNFLGNNGIEWHFNPPTASHFGGEWETMIRTTRKILYSLLKEPGSMLDNEMLSTVFCEAENILNNRPLTTTSNDPNDMLPLTPNMLTNPGGKPLEAPESLRSQTSMRKDV